jgi:hypothetical protein
MNSTDKTISLLWRLLKTSEARHLSAVVYVPGKLFSILSNAETAATAGAEKILHDSPLFSRRAGMWL